MARPASMPAAVRWPSSSARSLRHALTQISVGALLLGLVELAFILSPGHAEPWSVFTSVVVGAWVYVAAGWIAWSRRPNLGLGSLLVVGGYSLLLLNLGVTGLPVLVAVAQITATLPLAVLVHILHGFPSGRLRTKTSRLLVLSAYANSLVLQAPQYMFRGTPPPYDLVVVGDRPDVVHVAHWVQIWVGVVIVLATTVVLVGLLRRAEPARRSILAPLYGYGILAVLFVPLAPNVIGPWFGMPAGTSGVTMMQLVDFAGVPVFFTLSLLRGGFARTEQIEELGAWLSTADTGRRPLVAALRRALGDNTIRLLFWTAERESFVDEPGDRVAPPEGTDRAFIDITLAGERIGAIDYDPMLNPDPQVVRAAGRVIATSLDRERVSAELRASQQELRRSRVRIVEAGDAERRRIARDLHDGLQMRLVLLAMDAQQIAEDPTAPQRVRDSALALRVRVDAAAAESRDLVHEVLPAPLIEGGLSAATEDLVDHLPIPTRLDITLGDLPLPGVVESTAYFVLAEALGNALKHASPATLTVRLARAGDLLRVEVSDDGPGGAGPGGGSGLRGLNDRVDTIGGRLQVLSPLGHGTRIVAELPCALDGPAADTET